MTVKLLTELHMEFLSLNGGCTSWSESTLGKTSHCWKSHVTAHMEECINQAGVRLTKTDLELYINTDNWIGFYIFIRASA